MRGAVVAVVAIVAILAGAGMGYLVGNANRRTVTNTVLSQYPVTFLGMPKGCAVEGFCINSTLVNRLGSNISVIMSGWFRNVTTGQNITVGKNSVVYSSCTVDARKPAPCLLLAIPAPTGGPTFEVTLTVLALDGRTVLSPTVTADVTG